MLLLLAAELDCEEALPAIDKPLESGAGGGGTGGTF